MNNKMHVAISGLHFNILREPGLIHLMDQMGVIKKILNFLFFNINIRC